MPGTRSSTRESAEPLLARRAVHRTAHTPEVIVISSDDEEEARPPPPPPRSNRKRKTRQVEPSGDSSGLEVVGEDVEEELERLKKRLRQAQHYSTSLTEEAEKYKNQVDSLRKAQQSDKERIQKLQTTLEEHEKHRREEESRARKGKAVAAPSSSSPFSFALEDIEDNITCEICTLKMWDPWLLPQCGHIFCQKCITDWFSTIHANYLKTHPGYNAAQQMYGAHPALARMPAHVRANLFMNHFGGGGMPQPEYTCPTCRKQATHAPVECFAIKNIVSTVASKLGETDPRPQPRRGKGKARAPVGGPWDGFFGPS